MACHVLLHIPQWVPLFDLASTAVLAVALMVASSLRGPRFLLIRSVVTCPAS